MARAGQISRAKQRQGGRGHAKAGTTAPARVRQSPAPTLPMLRTSERSTLKTCEFQWYLTYVRQLRLGTPAPALRFGTLVHKALADWYIKGEKRGKNPVKQFLRYYDQDVKDNESKFGWRLASDEPWMEARELGEQMLSNYLEVYGTDPDWEVLATEHPFQVTVYHPDTFDPNHPPEAQEGAREWFQYVGVLDGVWRHRRKREIWIPDHKTTASLSDSKLGYLQMDDQAGAYWSWGVEYLVQQKYLSDNRGLNGMLYNFLRKGIPDERESKIVKGKRLYLNKDGSVSKNQPPPLLRRIPIFRDEPDRQMAMERAIGDFKRIEMLRTGALQVGKSPGMMNCPGCPVRDACELHETGQDWEGFLKAAAYGWEPYAEHEIYAGDTK